MLRDKEGLFSGAGHAGGLLLQAGAVSDTDGLVGEGTDDGVGNVVLGKDDGGAKTFELEFSADGRVFDVGHLLLPETFAVEATGPEQAEEGAKKELQPRMRGGGAHDDGVLNKEIVFSPQETSSGAESGRVGRACLERKDAIEFLDFGGVAGGGRKVGEGGAGFFEIALDGVEESLEEGEVGFLKEGGFRTDVFLSAIEALFDAP